MKKNTTTSQFPHFSRVISELSSLFNNSGSKSSLRVGIHSFIYVFLIGGVCLFIVLNVLYQRSLPVQFTELLNNPFDTGVLSKLYFRTNDPLVKQQAYSQLQYMGESIALSRIEAEQTARRDKILSLLNLVSFTPDFPDAYAYAASLFAQERDCASARAYLQKAIQLDPNREVFRSLESSIQVCK